MRELSAFGASAAEQVSGRAACACAIVAGHSMSVAEGYAEPDFVTVAVAAALLRVAVTVVIATVASLA